MTQKKGAAEATPLKDKGKVTNFNQHYIGILDLIYYFSIGYLLGTIGGLIL